MEEQIDTGATERGLGQPQGLSFLTYRKFLKSSEIVYNGLEIKNDMTKERMCWIRHDVVYEVFCFGLGDCTI